MTTDPKVKIRVENTYSDGHESEHTAEVDPPASMATEDIDDWWDETVFDETGDGHGINRSDLGSCYTATVMEAADFPALVGQSHEWVD